MKSLLLMALVASVSIGAVAEHHGDSDRGRKGSMFKQIDVDGDGAVSREEHEAAIARMADDRRERFNTMDSDGDGSVTRKEAAAARKHRKEGHKPRDRALD